VADGGELRRLIDDRTAPPAVRSGLVAGAWVVRPAGPGGRRGMRQAYAQSTGPEDGLVLVRAYELTADGERPVDAGRLVPIPAGWSGRAPAAVWARRPPAPVAPWWRPVAGLTAGAVLGLTASIAVISAVERAAGLTTVRATVTDLRPDEPGRDSYRVSAETDDGDGIRFRSNDGVLPYEGIRPGAPLSLSLSETTGRTLEVRTEGGGFRLHLTPSREWVVIPAGVAVLSLAFALLFCWRRLHWVALGAAFMAATWSAEVLL
jgi:hypothetical protein